MKTMVLLCMAIFSVPAWSQIDSPRPYKPLHAELFRRAQSSELIAIVTAVERRPIGMRLIDYDAPDLSKAHGGSLYVLQVGEVLCARTDFDVKSRKARPRPDRILVFKDRIDGEYYQLGQRYLVFLTPHRKQKDLATTYRLDAGTTYYEAFEGERGLIPLGAENSASVTQIMRFCKALNPAAPEVKIQRLTTLLGSEDAVLDLAADQAIDFFKQQMTSR